MGKSKKYKSDLLTNIQTFASIILSIVAVVSLLISYSSLQQNRELIKATLNEINATLDTLSPLEARLKVAVVEEKNNLIFSKSELCKNYTNYDTEIRLTNRGRAESGSINVKLYNDWINEKKSYIENIKSLDSIYVEFNLSIVNCSSDYLKNIPNGLQQIVVELDCNRCNPQKYKENITICIWGEDNTYTECKNFLNI